jgi:hypothetical protein
LESLEEWVSEWRKNLRCQIEIRMID